MRDEFDKEVKEILARRVGYLCSNPNCRKLTSGPQTDPTKALNIGVAAHITAASSGGCRYNASLSSQERKSVINGIWLCQNCAKLIDNDEQKYTVELLLEWKKTAEQQALFEVENLNAKKDNVEFLFNRIEELSSRGFAEVNQRLSDIETLLKPLAQQGAANQGLSFSSPQSGGFLKYTILGLEDKELFSWLSLFADEPPQAGAKPKPEITEVYFDDFDEMKQVFTSMTSIVAKAKTIERAGVDRQQAFEQAWNEEARSRAADYIVETVFSKRNQNVITDTIKETGLKYIIFGLTDHVTTIKGLRPREIHKGPTPTRRDANELYFESIEAIPEIPQIIQRAVQDANGDNEEFVRHLVKAVLTFRMKRNRNE